MRVQVSRRSWSWFGLAAGILTSCGPRRGDVQLPPGVAPVSVREETLTLPTRGVEPDPFPLFRATHGALSYLHPRNDVLTREKRDHAYRALVLENECLRVTVVPELGRRILSMFVKSAGVELIRREGVIQRGSGGAGLPVHAVTERGPDGSAAIVVGDVIPPGVQWRVRMILKPGGLSTTEQVRVFNRSDATLRIDFSDVMPPALLAPHRSLARESVGAPDDAGRIIGIEAVRDPPGEVTACSLGKAALRRRDWPAAEKRFTEAVQADAEDLCAIAGVLIAQARAQRDGLRKEPPDRALLERGLALDPLDTQLRLAERLMAGRMDVDDLVPKDRCGLRLALDMVDDGFFTVAMECGRRCVDQQPLGLYLAADMAAQTGSARAVLAHAFRAQAQLASPAGVFPAEPELLPILDREAERNPKDGRVRYYLGCLFMALDRGEEALAAWRAAAERGEDTAFLHRNLGLALWKIAKTPGPAVAEYERAITLAAREAQPVLELDEILKETGQRDRRVDMLEPAIGRVARRKGDVAERLAEAYIAVERYDEAAAVLAGNVFDDVSEAVRLRELHVAASIAAGDGASASGNDVRARAAYEAAASYPPKLLMPEPAPRLRKDARALWKLSLACARLGDAAAAEAARRRIVEEDHPPDSPLAAYKGFALWHLGHVDQAMRLFDDMIAAGERFESSDAFRYHLLTALGMRGKAVWWAVIPHFEEVLKRDPGNPYAQDFLDQSRAQVGRF